MKSILRISRLIMIKCFYYYFGKVNFRAARKLESTSDIRIVDKRVSYSFRTFPTTLSRLTNLWRRVLCKFDAVLYFSNYEKQISTSYFPSSAFAHPSGSRDGISFQKQIGPTDRKQGFAMHPRTTLGILTYVPCFSLQAEFYIAPKCHQILLLFYWLIFHLPHRQRKIYCWVKREGGFRHEMNLLLLLWRA